MTGERKVLVVGLGIAGMATAARLADLGWTVVIVERALRRRTGGYFIGLFRPAEQAADRLGVLSTLHLRTPSVHGSWSVDRRGRRRSTVGFLDQPGHPDGVLRGDIEQALWESIAPRVEVRFGTDPLAIWQGPNAAKVTLQNKQAATTYDEYFDLVVGADGLRSTVRRLVFGPDEDYLRPFHTIVCALSLSHQVTGYDAHDQIMVVEPRRALWVFPFRDHPPTALLTYRTRDPGADFRRNHREVLTTRFTGLEAGGIVPEVVDELRAQPGALFDSVHQVVMRRWHQGRVVLIGDAAWCLTLFSGMGAGSALIGAVALGDALERHPDSHPQALRSWQRHMRPLIHRHRRLAHLKAQFFVPSNPLIAALRRALLRLARPRTPARR
ncbi:FAD-dependent monooxygenase [Actinoplanes sp. TRM 88003]|uniref:FAD-dependent monooxygenase n=1 Tax=Paractinoplanes aksuensis TaxID=2939490 RepID=A0ABT1DSJ2_9ACTN|nr:FAD-dependent monooxygenase [Actinoplanes aksuensis]MCO8273819.1 FAD-dependent monooxygenase [Actinoplanes aksuensis]